MRLMSSHRHVNTVFRLDGVYGKLFSAILLTLVAAVIAGGRGDSAAFESSEVKFADASPSGLAIIPASCPSSPHWTLPGDCTCQLSASPTSIDAGEDVTLSWTSTEYHYDRTTIVGSISPDVGRVYAIGTATVRPQQTTTYRFQYDTGFSCSRTVAVTPAPAFSCIGSTPPNAGLCSGDDTNLTQNTSRALAGSCTSRKCEYTCSGGYSLENGRCEPDPDALRYSCSSNNQCVQSVGGSYTTSNCNNACSSTPQQRFSCNSNGQCIASAGGAYTTSNCNNVCAPPQCPLSANEVRQGGVCVCRAGYNRDPSTGQCVQQCTPGIRCIANQWCTVTNVCGVISCSGSCVVGGTKSVDIDANPLTVRSGGKTQVTWTSANYPYCSVTENNPAITDSWNTRTGSKQSSIIEQKTVYTLVCTDEYGVDSAPATVTVNVIPIFIEQ